MSTQTNIPQPTNGSTTELEWWQSPTDQHVSDNISCENYTLVVGYTKDEAAKEAVKQGDGKLSAKPEGEDTEEAIAKGEFVEAFRQTFRQYFPSNLDGVNELIPDDEEKVNLVYNSLKVKEANKARALVCSKAFSPVEHVIDLFEVSGQKSERRLSAFEKTEKEIFSNFSEADRKKLLEKLLAMQS